MIDNTQLLDYFDRIKSIANELEAKALEMQEIIEATTEVLEEVENAKELLEEKKEEVKEAEQWLKYKEEEVKEIEKKRANFDHDIKHLLNKVMALRGEYYS